MLLAISNYILLAGCNSTWKRGMRCLLASGIYKLYFSREVSKWYGAISYTPRSMQNYSSRDWHSRYRKERLLKRIYNIVSWWMTTSSWSCLKLGKVGEIESKTKETATNSHPDRQEHDREMFDRRHNYQCSSIIELRVLDLKYKILWKIMKQV